MDLFTLTIGISILVYVLIGSYAGRSVKKLDDYFVAGRRAPTLLILGTLVASVMSTAIFMGEAAFTYDGQLGAYLLFPGIAVTGYMLGALFFGRFAQGNNAIVFFIHVASYSPDSPTLASSITPLEKNYHPTLRIFEVLLQTNQFGLERF